jgi:glucose/arabinose dehydrogenase
VKISKNRRSRPRKLNIAPELQAPITGNFRCNSTSAPKTRTRDHFPLFSATLWAAQNEGRLFIAMVFLLFGLSFSASATTLPAGFVETTVASGIASPTAMAIAPDGRIFVCSQTGALRVIKNGVLLANPFVTLSVDSTGERGLLGVALDPNFNFNHYVYLYYTVPGTPAHNRVTRFTANGDVVAPGSARIILELDPLSTATNHNGGALRFGPDGKLYIATGENAWTLQRCTGMHPRMAEHR